MKNWLLAASALAGGFAISPAVSAQGAPAAPPATAPAATPAKAPATPPPPPPPMVDVAPASDAVGNELITVTGSRIRRAGFDTLEPALVVSQEYLDKRGLTNVADALNELPGFGVGVTPEGGQSGFGVGQNFVNRFGLGSQRTLTVVNGRRFVSSNAATIFGPAGNSNGPGLQVDLNVIPQIMVERIENLTIGGAPTYGSDAIAGTVNIILKRKFEGLEVRALSGLSERGDGQRLAFQAL
jgi:outer membrane receptor protein involved in Fe transport